MIFASGATVTTLSRGDCMYEWTPTSREATMGGVVTVFFYWSIQLWLCMRFYVASLTTGVWYYNNESLAAQEGSVDRTKYAHAASRPSGRLPTKLA